MTTYQIELLEPKAKKLLDDLAELKLIRIQEAPASDVTPKRDLSPFFGVWTDEDAAEFNEAVKIFEQIDEEIWK